MPWDLKKRKRKLDNIGNRKPYEQATKRTIGTLDTYKTVTKDFL